MRNPFTLPLAAQDIDAIDPDPEKYAAEVRIIEGIESDKKALFTTLKVNFEQRFRRLIAGPVVIETGKQIAAQREAIVEQRKQTETRARAVQRRAGAVGLPARIFNSDAQADEGTRMMLQAKRANVKEQAATAKPMNQ